MHLKTIRNPNNRVIGFISFDVHGNGVARDAHMRFLGRYNAQRDVTYDAHNRQFGHNDQLTALLHGAQQP
ncbi:hypothetical protein [Cupriavidus taiwanensis]|uniref:Uncharacterized protein n=1 Tax=Cupriavidus taiwanensis TaxID=164546 RepID=A0A7Z7NRB9_9BURK|nr:hypothetical protein [Cupriavidus taiwanensis]SOZ17167.1 conserved hypothetical protein [Cupriavidus taiwanensis]SOZ96523.1 conserved hypothetical protein [Cupriavidus taiwanensis]SPC25550.1 conserved hypothetical protein [Cupriavidus taiwanensis]